MKLTPKGERWLLALYENAVALLVVLTFLAVLGFVGWIETQ